jgi:hypothetical protein
MKNNKEDNKYKVLLKKNHKVSINSFRKVNNSGFVADKFKKNN